MGCDTKGVVKGNFEGRIFEVVDKIIAGIDAVCERKHPLFSNKTVASGCFAEKRIAMNGYITIDFKDGDDNRMLNVHFNCHCDYEELFKGNKLILSLGMWGRSDEIMQSILNQFDEETYFIENDCGKYTKESSLYHLSALTK